jgi:hypothetical protein
VTILDGPVRTGPGGLTIFSRRDFCENRFHYKPGEHMVFGGPSTKGKTRFSFDLLAHIVSPEFPAYVAQSKPRDKETEQGARRLHFREVQEWPPPPKIQEMKMFSGPPPGYLVKPKFGDIDQDMERCARVTARLLGDRYTAGVHGKKGILVMDDTMVKAKIMGLDNQMVTIIAMAGAMGIGEWVFIQKPTDSGKITLWAYENGIHLAFTKGGDARMLRRYAEIAGENGPIVIEVVPKLKDYQFLYMHKYEGWICIVDKG